MSESLAAVVCRFLTHRRALGRKYHSEERELRLLVRFAEALRDETRRSSSLARLGGDEFAMLIPGADEAEALNTADRLLAMLLSRTFAIAGRDVRLSASIGIAAFPRHGRTPDELLSKADKAMYRVKDSGKNNIRLAD